MCPRCSAFVIDDADVIHISDTPDGLYVVTSEPVTDHVIECRCGADIAVTSSQPVTHHPGQLRLVERVA